MDGTSVASVLYRSVVQWLIRFVQHLLDTMPYGQAALFFLAQNLLVFVSALVLGLVMVRRFSSNRITPAPPQIERLELGLAACTVLLNAGITLAGLVLYRSGIIVIDTSLSPLEVLRDVLVLVLVMDGAMYFLHRLAHHRWLMPILHEAHHRYVHPRPLTLFVLHPFENLSFGALWLLVLASYEATWLGVVIYLTLNLLFGVMGHLGVEPMPSSKHVGLSWIGTSSFHARHHLSHGTNFGFYTTVWDRLFGTLAPTDDASLDS